MNLTIQRPDDWHLHIRDGDALRAVIAHTANQFGRAIIMPNLKPPVTDAEAAVAYRQRILDALPAGNRFQPLMTLYLTDRTSPETIRSAMESGIVNAVKYYPAGATTNSDAGVTRIENTWSALDALQEAGMPLLVHGEVTDPTVDIFDREAVFIEQVLEPVTKRFPALKIVLEHITTQQGIDFVNGMPDNIAGTLTAHHLLLNRNALFVGGIRPHNYCLPILKREQHRQALVKAATSGNPKFFLGTDSAPHPRQAKESACGCAGLYTAHAAIELYAEAFELAGALDKLEAFASHFGPDFYGLPRNKDTITLTRKAWTVPDAYPMGQDRLIPMRAGEVLHWKLTG
ncbi:dihydroorotase [Thiogranum longum]|uniref:Dihydroorotase n=1 Tax=Thiogranum longum TaxID=1537524 RepID=A0A4R1HEE3_9GAMM|nr:dihydroorotase [Thiogranum longum]TCK19101.1 dihydroorotase [Thiogranum longum]